MSIFTHPNSFRNANPALPIVNYMTSSGVLFRNVLDQSPFAIAKEGAPPPHSSHPNFGHLTLLVFEAVLEVVCVSLPGYILARNGLFNPDMQKFAANLIVILFTPCLIFNKLASQLTTDKLVDLAVIPVIYVVQVLISYLCALMVAKVFGFKKRKRNFVIAMGVFGNSNSLPISLVLSLSRTIRGLHWENIPGDNDEEVGARGILYLLIFQQLGQLLRWSWGINVLLSKRNENIEYDDHTNSRLERGQSGSLDSAAHDQEPFIAKSAGDKKNVSGMIGETSREPAMETESNYHRSAGGSNHVFESGGETPVTSRQSTSSISSNAPSRYGSFHSTPVDGLLVPPANGNLVGSASNGILKSSTTSEIRPLTREIGTHGINTTCPESNSTIKSKFLGLSRRISDFFGSMFRALPPNFRQVLSKVLLSLRVCWQFLCKSMNPPLFAMGIALIVASVPSLQRLFFSDGTFVKNSITSAIRQSGGVAVPLILVVLGANLARESNVGDSANPSEDDAKQETRLVVASLLARMVLPTIFMVPLLAIAAKYVPISILDDPIFVIVCFLLSGAPSALQLAQICQLNDVYMGAMTRILFQSYVIWILPSTLILVMCALEVVEWAAA